MRILITNDDGIKAEGLISLVKWAAKYGEVTTVAPLHEQSGKSQGIDIFHPIAVTKYDLCPETTAYAVDSTPADCVRFGIIGLGQTYDLVISGINRGYNIGQDIVYSGTVGAIYEAAAQGHKGMALSTDPSTLPGALCQLDNVYKFFERNNLFGMPALRIKAKRGWLRRSAILRITNRSKIFDRIVKLIFQPDSRFFEKGFDKMINHFLVSL